MTTKPKPLSEYERARLHLLAWQMLDGWGTKDPQGQHKNWDMSERRQKATEMVAWALRQ